MKTLFVTATAQTEANYYLIWHFFKQSNTDIEKIVIISTEFTREKGYVDNLTSVLNALQIGSEDSSVTIEELPLQNGVEENNVEAIKDVLLQWIAHNKASQIIFNITGGTKLMSIAQDQIAQISSRYDCVYQSRANNQLVWYNRPPGKQCYDLVLPENLEARLKGRGYQTVSSETSFLALPAQQYHYIQQMYKYLDINLDKAKDLVFVLNALAAKVINEPEHSFPHTVEVRDGYRLKQCITWLKLLTKLPQPYFSYDSEAGTVTWKTKQAVEFVGGKWFEVLTGLLIVQHYIARQQQVDVQIGLQFKKTSDGNEVDVAYINSSYLHLFECKTVNWDNQNNPTTKVNADLRKFDSVGQVGGLNTHKYFVSLFDISDQSLAVAKDTGIEVIMGKQLLDFGRYIA
ncbi:Card1-like endonuclease domain-containing protein [Psychrobacter jeotgali]|uniref:Card1-like endonuclease domain-containing protein n=1 Tax=Psychrobacter jeotgali TaxID=179010 RepID=UPI0019182FED|nr:DUF1887 family CARF protein [Psychrobacter jeotgali]